MLCSILAMVNVRKGCFDSSMSVLIFIAMVHRVENHVCILRKRPDHSPGGGDLMWSLTKAEVCHCQGVVAPESVTACPTMENFVSDERWFVDDTRTLVLRANWKKDILDNILQRQEYCADECSLMTHNCDENAICYDISGGFNCVCTVGFSGDGVTCWDIDECKDNTDNCADDATCTNAEGSFTCQCNNGYRGDGITCIVCEDYMGVASSEIPNDRISASSIHGTGYEAFKGRLNAGTNWLASSTDNSPWIQADIGYQVFVTGVVTKGDGGWGGHQDWVASYKVSTFTIDDHTSEVLVMSGAEVVIFDGNDDSTNTKTSYFPAPVFARIVRIICVEKGRADFAMKFEILGCNEPQILN